MTAALNALPLRIREMRDGDLPFVVSTWALSIPCPKWFDELAWKSNARRSISAIIKSSKVVVLCNANNDAAIEGWACGSNSYLHHAYVRPSYVKHAMAQQLIEDMRRAL